MADAKKWCQCGQSDTLKKTLHLPIYIVASPARTVFLKRPCQSWFWKEEVKAGETTEGNGWRKSGRCSQVEASKPILPPSSAFLDPRQAEPSCEMAMELTHVKKKKPTMINATCCGNKEHKAPGDKLLGGLWKKILIH